MGFRTGAYATVWDIKPRSEKVTQIRISISKKPKGSEEYVQDFSGFCSCIGDTTAKAARALNVKDRIKLGDVDVCTTYVKDKDVTYTNYNIYTFEKVENNNSPTGYVDPEIEDVDDIEEGIPF